MTVWRTSTFDGRLGELGMVPGRDGQYLGLELVANLSKAREPSVRIALEEAERYGADAVFFRQVSPHSPVPQMYVYDRTGTLEESGAEEFGQIQRRLWNASGVPLAAVLTSDAVRLFSCRQQPKSEHSNSFVCAWFERLEAALAVEKQLLRHGIESGTLWEDPRFSEAFSLDGSAYHTLLKHLRHFKTELLEGGRFPDSLAKRVLVLAILLKYLEDRKDNQGNGVFPADFATRFANGRARTLPELFTIPGACVELFDELGRHFNGGIFSLPTDERHELQTADLTPVAYFLNGTMEPGGQQLFWPLYSFDDLPVELVSNIYEEFLAKGGVKGNKDIVYTPPILAELLLGETLPLSPESLKLRVLDPACGSGIFLVGAFRRLVHCWRIANDWRRPGHHDLKEILRRNIFGVDLKEDAVLVAAFSLCVALCDELNPKVIWEELRFDDLQGKNLFATDFFKFISDPAAPKNFDLVIGNPPFNSKLNTPAAQAAEKLAAKDRPPIPDNQIALLFLDQVFNVCSDNGRVCLIQPAGPLLYNIKSSEFRRWLLEKIDIRLVLDFTPLESVLFKANVAAAAVIAYNRPPEGDEILHVVFHPTRANKNLLALETNSYDFHRLGRELVKRNPYAWKTDLLGGGRLHRLIKERFVGKATLGEFLADKRKKEGWQFGEGFNVGCGKNLNRPENLEKTVGLDDKQVNATFNPSRKVMRATHLTGKTCVPPPALVLDGIIKEQCRPLEDVFFERDRSERKEIFLPPHVLIRETIAEGSIPVVFSNEELVFSKQIFGIHAPKGQEGELKDIAERLSQSPLYSALLAATSSRYLVGKATSLLANDLLSLPYPDQSKLELGEWEDELVRDVVGVWALLRRHGEKSSALKPTTQNELRQFATTYCRELNACYKDFRQLEPIFIGRNKHFVCHPFCYGAEPEISLPKDDEAEQVLADLCHRQRGPRLFVNRVIRLYERNVVLMIKPNQKRFWLRSMAMRDADETVAELIEAGY